MVLSIFSQSQSAGGNRNKTVDQRDRRNSRWWEPKLRQQMFQKQLFITRADTTLNLRSLYGCSTEIQWFTRSRRCLTLFNIRISHSVVVS
jgi:hypothetical protein